MPRSVNLAEALLSPTLFPETASAPGTTLGSARKKALQPGTVVQERRSATVPVAAAPSKPVAFRYPGIPLAGAARTSEGQCRFEHAAADDGRTPSIRTNCGRVHVAGSH